MSNKIVSAITDGKFTAVTLPVKPVKEPKAIKEPKVVEAPKPVAKPKIIEVDKVTELSKIQKMALIAISNNKMKMVSPQTKSVLAKMGLFTVGKTGITMTKNGEATLKAAIAEMK